MFYTLLGKLTWKVIRIVLRRRYGATMMPKPLIAVALIAVVVGVALVLQRRDSS